jgi:hypothetical protein
VHHICIKGEGTMFDREDIELTIMTRGDISEDFLSGPATAIAVE